MPDRLSSAFLIVIAKARWTENWQYARMKVRSLLCEYRVMQGMDTGFPSFSPPKWPPSRICVGDEVISSLALLQRHWEGCGLHTASLGIPLWVLVLLGKVIWYQILCVFESIGFINILSIVYLPFLSLMDDLIIACKGVCHPRKLGKNAVVELICHWIVSSMEGPLCEVLWWSWPGIGDTWVSSMEKTFQAFLCNPSTNFTWSGSDIVYYTLLCCWLIPSPTEGATLCDNPTLHHHSDCCLIFTDHHAHWSDHHRWHPNYLRINAWLT